MDILLSNEWLVTTGGTGTFTYTLAGELTKRGHNVFLFTNEWGGLADRICKDLGVKPYENRKYDLILANHHSTVKKLHKQGPTIQTCHGIFPFLEQPSKYAHGHVAISKEVQNHLLRKNFSSTIILNGINCERFNSIKGLNIEKPVVLSMCHSIEAHNNVEKAALSLGMEFKKLDKRNDWKWEVEMEINACDIVVGLGRSAYEALACGRPVIIYDKRHYSSSIGDGYFLNNFMSFVQHNCSGRFSNNNMGVDELIRELKKYKPNHGTIARELALNNFNIGKTVDEYFNYLKIIKTAQEHQKLGNKLKRKIFPILNQLIPYTPRLLRKLGKIIVNDKGDFHEYY